MKCSRSRTNAGHLGDEEGCKLSPEEDAVGSILDEADDIDDSLPADLWFHSRQIGAAVGPRFERTAVTIRLA